MFKTFWEVTLEVCGTFDCNNNIIQKATVHVNIMHPFILL